MSTTTRHTGALRRTIDMSNAHQNNSAASRVLVVDDLPSVVSVGSGDGLGARPRMRSRSPLLLASLAMLSCGGAMGLPSGMLAFRPEDDPIVTPEDRARLASAEDKRERKRLRKEAAKTRAPNK